MVSGRLSAFRLTKFSTYDGLKVELYVYLKHNFDFSRNLT